MRALQIKTLQTLEATAHIKTFLSGAYKEDDLTLTTDINEGSANISIINNKGKKMPTTGSNETIVMLGAGIVVMFASMKMFKNGKKDKVAE